MKALVSGGSRGIGAAVVRRLCADGAQVSFLYAAVRAANDVPELRRRLRDGEVIEYDRCQPSYTAMRPNGVYVYCLVDRAVRCPMRRSSGRGSGSSRRRWNGRN